MTALAELRSAIGATMDDLLTACRIKPETEGTQHVTTETQRRLDREPCPKCGGDRLRMDFTDTCDCLVYVETGKCPHLQPLDEFQQAMAGALAPIIEAYRRFENEVGQETLRGWMDEIRAAQRRTFRYRAWRRCTIISIRLTDLFGRIAERCEDRQWRAGGY